MRTSILVVLTAVCAVLIGAGRAPAGIIDFVADGDTNIGNGTTDPLEAGAYSEAAGVHTLTGGGSDWWSSGERAHIAYTQASGDFRIEAEVNITVIAPGGDGGWTKAGVFARNDIDSGAGNGGEKEVNAFVVATNTQGGSFQYRLAPDANMVSLQSTGTRPTKVALQRNTYGGLQFVQGFMDRGAGWQLLGSVLIPDLVNDPYVGLGITSHNNGAGETATAEFQNVVLSDPAYVMPGPTADMRVLNDPTYPKGTYGVFGVREVAFNDTSTTLPTGMVWIDYAFQKLNDIYAGSSTAKFTREYQAAAFNLQDNGHIGIPRYAPTPYQITGGVTGGFTYTGDRFEMVNQGDFAYGAIDHAALVAQAYVKVPAGQADWYTFDVNSDDGFELAIDGKVVSFANNKGISDVLGQVYLGEGTHEMRLMYFEVTGGTTVQLLGAKGYLTAFDKAKFNIVGGPALPAVDYPDPPTFKSAFRIATLTRTAAPSPWNMDMAVTEMRAYLADGTVPADATAAEGTATYINHQDPDNGGGGHIAINTAAGSEGHPFTPGKGNFPNDGGLKLKEDYFSAGLTGTLNFSEGGQFTFFAWADDDVQFKLFGKSTADWDDLDTSNKTGGTMTLVSEADGSGFRVVGAGKIGYGTITLAAGDYDLEVLMRENTGGAYVSVFMKYGLWTDPTPIWRLGDAGSFDMPEVPALPLELVPEPATMALLALGGLGLLIRRKR